MTGFFFYGTACHGPLLRAVLGREVPQCTAFLAGYSVFWDATNLLPVLIPGGEGVEGIYVPDLTDEDVARLDYCETAFGYHTRELTVQTESGHSPVAQVFFSDDGRLQPDMPWDFDAWRALWAETVVAATIDLMAHFGDTPAAVVRRRYLQILTRGGASVRAGFLRDGTETLRRSVAPGDVVRLHLSHPYEAYFAVEEHEISYRRFDGLMSPTLNRAVFISGDAAIVLPYDPLRDRVMLIEQFRAGPYARGDANPWLLEAIAGRIDGGETPEQAAQREALEEAGLTLRDLLPGPRYYPTPAAKAEYLYSFVGIADLPDGSDGVGGLESEAEDIRSHLISFDRLMELVASGEADNAPLLLLAYWLSTERAAIRKKYGA